MLLDLQDIVYMTEQGLCAPENWPPKHSAKFVQEFKQEELEPAESTMEDSTVTLPPPPPKKSHRDNRASFSGMLTVRSLFGSQEFKISIIFSVICMLLK